MVVVGNSYYSFEIGDEVHETNVNRLHCLSVNIQRAGMTQVLFNMHPR